MRAHARGLVEFAGRIPCRRLLHHRLKRGGDAWRNCLKTPLAQETTCSRKTDGKTEPDLRAGARLLATIRSLFRRRASRDSLRGQPSADDSGRSDTAL